VRAENYSLPVTLNVITCVAVPAGICAVNVVQRITIANHTLHMLVRSGLRGNPPDRYGAPQCANEIFSS
jgi:hypothetical protein